MDRLWLQGKYMVRPSVLAGLIWVIVAGSAPAQTSSIGVNFQTIDRTTTGTVSGFLIEPPDTTGAVGLNHFIALNNGSFSIFNKNGTLATTRQSDGQFWTAAGITISTGVLSDPRILYDPGSRRWFACEISTNESTNNRVLIARSNTSDPTAGFSAVTLQSSNGQFADFPTLGVDSNGVVIGTNNFDSTHTANLSASIYSVPKADILAGTPTVANLTQNTISLGGGAPLGTIPQPAVNYGSILTTARTPVVFGFNSTNVTVENLTNTNVQTPGGATLGSRNFVMVNSRTTPSASGQGSGTITNGDTRHGSHAVQIGNFLYTASSSAGAGGTTVARWTIYNVTTATPTLAAQGEVSDPTLSFFYPSIGVNSSGDVVMGFSGSASGQFIGTYAVVGTSSGPGGAITFGTPFQTKAGTGTSTNVRWGDYSTTNPDPSDPGIFWTHQEWANAGLNWATQATEIIPNKTGERRWSSTTSGSFTTPSNYFTATAPVPTDHVIFSRNGATYTVNSLSGQVSDRASVGQGTVTWDMTGGTYTLSNSSPTTPSLSVGEFQGTTSLTLSGGTLSSVNATIGAGFGGNGTVNVGGASPATWDHVGTIYVGGNSAGPQGGTGKLVVNAGSTLINPVGTVQVHPGGTLSGNGTIVGAVNVTGGQTTVYSDGSTVGTNRVSVNSITVPAATIAPGTSVGTIATGPLTINNGGAYAWEVAAVGTGNVPLNSGNSDVGASKDLITVTGALTLTSPEIDVIGLGSHGFNNAQTYSWTIASFTGIGSLTGTPTFVLSNITPLAGSQFTLGVGASSLFLNYNPVPEPASILAFCLIGGGLGAIWKRRARNRRAETPLAA